MVSVRVVRMAATVICVAGIAGMIVTSILNHNGAAVTFGLVSAVAVVCAMVAKAVAADTERRLVGTGALLPGEPGAVLPGDAGPDGGVGGVGGAGPGADALAELVEGQVQALIGGGAEEGVVRQLVGESVRLGRCLELGDSATRRPVVDGPH